MQTFIKKRGKWLVAGIALVISLAMVFGSVSVALSGGNVGQTSLGWKNQPQKQEWNDGNYGEYPEGDYWQCQITMDNNTDDPIDITEFGIAFDFWQSSSEPLGGAVGVDWTRNWAWTMTESDFFTKGQSTPRYPYTGDPLSPTWSGTWTPFTPAIWNMPYDPATEWYTLTESCASPALSHFYSYFCANESGSGIPNMLPAHTRLAIYCEPHLALTYLWSNSLGGTLPINGVYDGGTTYDRSSWTCDWYGAGHFSGSSMHGIIVYSGAKTFQLPSGVVVSGSISGHKYDDVDGSGDLTPGDVGIEGWPIALTGTVEGSPVGPVITYTDASGYYEYPDLPEGSGPFCVEEAPENGLAVPSGYEGYSHTSPYEICGIYVSSADNDFFNVGCGEVSITKTDSPSELGCPGETISYTLTVTNDGPATATGVYVEDTLPTNMTLGDVWLDTTLLTEGVDYSVSGGVLRYPMVGGVELVDGESFILTIEGIATDCDPLENSATVYADNDCSEEGNTAATTTERNIPPVVANLITNDGVGPCLSQSEVDAAYALWYGALSFSGGCNLDATIVIPDPPDHCGGIATVTWEVYSDCEDPIIGSADFTVDDAPAVVANLITNDGVGPCLSQSEVDAAYALWYGALSFSGGCNLDATIVIPDPPDYCGGIATVTWEVYSDCEDPIIGSADFTVPDRIGDPVLYGVPDDYFIEGCDVVPPTCADFAVTAFDICDVELEVTCTEGDTIQTSEMCYEKTFTFSAEDECGNYVEDSVTVSWCVCPTCETAVAAQGPSYGANLFPDARNWFTWITYVRDSGPQEYPIFTGKTHLCGTLYVENVGNTLYVVYTMDGGWYGFSAYHLQVDCSYSALEDAIVNDGDNPVPGDCEYKGTLDYEPFIELVADIEGCGETIYIFAHSMLCYTGPAPYRIFSYTVPLWWYSPTSYCYYLTR